MNLGTLLSWEQVYLSKVKEQPSFETDEDIIEYLKEAKHFDDFQINSAFDFYHFAKETFVAEQWQEIEELFSILNQARLEQEASTMIGVIGEVLWSMGNLFGTNHTDDFH